MWQNLERAAQEDGYVFATVDAANAKVHMVDKLFNEVARQIAWDDLVHVFLCVTLLDSSYLVPAEREEFSLSKIASLNGLDVGEMRAAINNRLRERLFQDYAMTHEFRMANWTRRTSSQEQLRNSENKASVVVIGPSY